MTYKVPNTKERFVIGVGLYAARFSIFSEFDIDGVDEILQHSDPIVSCTDIRKLVVEKLKTEIAHSEPLLQHISSLPPPITTPPTNVLQNCQSPATIATSVSTTTNSHTDMPSNSILGANISPTFPVAIPPSHCTALQALPPALRQTEPYSPRLTYTALQPCLQSPLPAPYTPSLPPMRFVQHLDRGSTNSTGQCTTNFHPLPNPPVHNCAAHNAPYCGSISTFANTQLVDPSHVAPVELTGGTQRSVHRGYGATHSSVHSYGQHRVPTNCRCHCGSTNSLLNEMQSYTNCNQQLHSNGGYAPMMASSNNSVCSMYTLSDSLSLRNPSVF